MQYGCQLTVAESVIGTVASRLSPQVRQDQDEDLRRLTHLRGSLRSLLQVDGKEVSSTGVWPPAKHLNLQPTGTPLSACLFDPQDNLNRKNSGNGYSIHQPQGNKKYGTEKSGFLLKKSDG